MKKLVSLKVLNLLIVLALMPLFAFAGGSAGGGGGGIVCNIQGQTRVLLYDIYDRSPVWKKKLQLTLIKSNEPAQVQLERAINRIENEFMRELVKEYLNKIIADIDWLEPDQQYKAGTDFGTQEAPVVPQGCDFRPIGYYFGEGFLAVDQSLYEAMSETSKAAFFMHEALYFIARETSNESDSTKVRKVVAGLFSENKPEFQLQKRIVELFQLGANIDSTNLVVLSSKPNLIKVDMNLLSQRENENRMISSKCEKEMFFRNWGYTSEHAIYLSESTYHAFKQFSGDCRQVQVYYGGNADSNHAHLQVKMIVDNNVQHIFKINNSGNVSAIDIFLVTRQPMPRLPLN